MEKKTIFFILVISLVMILCGCGSSDEYKYLEKKLNELEDRISKIEENTNIETSMSDGKKEDVQESENSFFYSIEGMNGEQIKNEVVQILTNLPKKGDVYENFITTYKVTPLKDKSETNRLDFFSSGSYELYRSDVIKSKWEKPEKDYIISIVLSGWYAEMDGTMGITDKTLVEVELVIHDYNLAVDVYDGLFNFLSKNYYDIRDNRETTYWESIGDFYPDGYDERKWMMNYIEVPFVTMEKKANSFTIHAKYYTVNGQ